MKKTLFIFIYALAVLHTGMPNNDKSYTDSLKNAIIIQSGKLRMEAMDLLARSYYSTPNELYYTRMWLNEARKQKDPEAEGISLVRMATYYSNAGQGDSLAWILKEAEPFWRNHKQYKTLFLGISLDINFLIFRGNYEIAIDKARKMYEEARALKNEDGRITACESIGLTYLYSNRLQEAIPYLKEALDLLKHSNKTFYTIDIYCYLIMATSTKKDYEVSLCYCRELENFLAAFEKSKDGKPQTSLPMEDTYLFLHCRYAQNLIWLKRTDEAKKHIDLAVKYSDADMEAHYLRELDYTFAVYYEAIGKYETALAYIDKSIAGSLVMEYKEKLLQKAGILEKAGKSSEANSIYRRQIAIDDSIFSANSDSQINQLRTIYQLDKIEEKAHTTRMYLYFASGVIILALIILSSYILYSLRLKRKNKTLYRRIVEQQQLQSELSFAKNRLSSLGETGGKGQGNISENAGGSKNNWKIIMEQIDVLMQTEQLYTDSNISRKTLSDRLNTNENYLATAIRENNRQTFSDHINAFRLEHALRLLKSQDQDSIEQIAYKSGFSSYKYFHKLFREQYGMSPTEFRKFSKTESTSN